jgi:Uma2 family endonuclease
MNYAMSAVPKIPAYLTLDEFLVWDAPGPERWQLVDGVPTAMAPASRSHGAIQIELGRLIGNHLAEKGLPCSVIAAPGLVPHINAKTNFRIPDLAVSCKAYEKEEYAVSGVVLAIEILSPSNKAETWLNVWAYASIPSVKEIAVFHSVRLGVELLRRGIDGGEGAFWPETPALIEKGDVTFESVGFSFPVAVAYRTTRLAAEAPK